MEPPGNQDRHPDGGWIVQRIDPVCSSAPALIVHNPGPLTDWLITFGWTLQQDLQKHQVNSADTRPLSCFWCNTATCADPDRQNWLFPFGEFRNHSSTCKRPRGMETFRKNLEFGSSLVVVVCVCSQWGSVDGGVGGGGWGVLQQQDVRHLPPTGVWAGLQSLVGGDSHHNGKSHLGVVTWGHRSGDTHKTTQTCP